MGKPKDVQVFQVSDLCPTLVKGEKWVRYSDIEPHIRTNEEAIKHLVAVCKILEKYERSTIIAEAEKFLHSQGIILW